MKDFLKVATFRVTSRCNNNCKLCFASKNVEEMGFSELTRLFRLLYSKGIKAVLLTGGEPLLREDFKEIVGELKRYSFKIFLETNGDFFFKYKRLISDNIDELVMPVDFPDRSYRNQGNLKAVLRALDYFKRDKRPMIRIGTVATQENIKALSEIGELLKKYPVDIWKIYQFIPQNLNAVRNRHLLEVAQEDFDEATERLKKDFSKFFKVVVYKRKEMNKAYFFINPDGTVFMPVDDGDVFQEERIGNIFEEDIFDRWGKLVSKKNYTGNIKSTFSR